MKCSITIFFSLIFIFEETMSNFRNILIHNFMFFVFLKSSFVRHLFAFIPYILAVHSLQVSSSLDKGSRFSLIGDIWWEKWELIIFPLSPSEFYFLPSYPVPSLQYFVSVNLTFFYLIILQIHVFCQRLRFSLLQP